MFCLVELYVNDQPKSEYVFYEKTGTDSIKVVILNLDDFSEVTIDRLYDLHDFEKGKEIIGLRHNIYFRRYLFSCCSRSACRMFNEFVIDSHEDVTEEFQQEGYNTELFSLYPSENEYISPLDYIAMHTDERIIPIKVTEIDTWYNWGILNIIKLFDRSLLDIFKKMSTDDFSLLIFEEESKYVIIRMRFKDRVAFKRFLLKLDLLLV